MDLVFIHGPPACGKLTVARALAESTGMRLFHNHLTVDLALSLFDFGSEGFVRLREAVWLEAFREAVRQEVSLIFTFNPEATVAGDFPQRVDELVRSLGGRVWFVELRCPDEVVEARIEATSRAEFGKLNSLQEYRKLRAAGAFDYPPLPPPLVSLDTSEFAPEAAAAAVEEALTLQGGGDG